MTIAVDLGHKATKQTNRTLYPNMLYAAHGQGTLMAHRLEMPFNAFAKRADPDQAALTRAA